MGSRDQKVLTAVERYVICERYEQDNSYAYGCGEEKLQILLGHFGEMEPIIDAMNVSSGASLETRARDIGCDVTDFPEYWENEEARETS